MSLDALIYDVFKCFKLEYGYCSDYCIILCCVRYTYTSSVEDKQSLFQRKKDYSCDLKPSQFVYAYIEALLDTEKDIFE